MFNFDGIISVYSEILHFVAELAVHTLELIGILVVIIGSARAIAHVASRIRRNQPVNIVLELGRTLALALEFKMGAEIVNTVIIRDLRELGILAIVIGLRAILAILIHWEIKNEQREVQMRKQAEDTSKTE